jgi:Leucine Rich repeat
MKTTIAPRIASIRRAGPILIGVLLGGWALAAAVDPGPSPALRPDVRALPGPPPVRTAADGPGRGAEAGLIPVAFDADMRPLICRRPGRPLEDEDLEGMRLAGRVHSLDLSLSRVTDTGLTILGRANGLRELNLFGTRVGDAGLAHLAGLMALRALYLESTPVGDAGLAHLAGLEHLEALTLSGTRVTDAGLVHLRGLTGLRDLDLSWTAVSEAGVEDLRRALPDARIGR